MSISGLCSGSSFDKHYYWTGEYSKDTELYYFRGFSNSLLNYDPRKSEWKLTNMYTNTDIYAICNESTIHPKIPNFDGTEPFPSYPFGTFHWYFFGDTCKGMEPEKSVAKNVYKLKISFNACDENKEFVCGDGTW